MEEKEKQDQHGKNINFDQNQRESSENPKNHSSSPVDPASLKDENKNEIQTPKQDPLKREEYKNYDDTNIHNHSYKEPSNQSQNSSINHPNERNSTQQENRQNNQESNKDSNK